MTTLAAIQARLDAATPGPWRRVTRMESCGEGDFDVDSIPGVLNKCVTSDSDGAAVYLDLMTGEDAEFIANAPADMRALLEFAKKVTASHQPEYWELDAFEYSQEGVGCSGCECGKCGDVEAHGPWPCPIAQAAIDAGIEIEIGES